MQTVTEVKVVDSVAAPLTAYNNVITEARSILKSLNTVGLESYHKLGGLVANLMDNPSKYGNRSIETFCTTLGWESTNAYDAAKFHRQYKFEEIKALTDAGITWRGVQSLLPVKDKAAVKKIVDQAHKVNSDDKAPARFTSENIRTEVAKLKNTDTPAATPTPLSDNTAVSVTTPKSVVKVLDKLKDRFQNTLGLIGDLILVKDDVKKLADAGVKAEAEKLIKDIEKVLSEIKQAIK